MGGTGHIIVNDGDTVYGSFVLETAVGTVESVQTSDDGICADSHGTGKGDGGHGISGIVSSGNGKFDFTDGLFVVHGGKRRTGFVIICQIICIIFTGIIKTVGDDLLWKSVGQFLMVCNFSIDNGEIAEPSGTNQRLPQQIITYGFDDSCEYYADNLTYDDKACPSFTAMHNKEAICEIKLAVPGRHNAGNAMAAIALACTMGISTDAIIRRSGRFPPVPTRPFPVQRNRRRYRHHPKTRLCAQLFQCLSQIPALVSLFVHSRNCYALSGISPSKPIPVYPSESSCCRK